MKFKKREFKELKLDISKILSSHGHLAHDSSRVPLKAGCHAYNTHDAWFVNRSSVALRLLLPIAIALTACAGFTARGDVVIPVPQAADALRQMSR